MWDLHSVKSNLICYCGPLCPLFRPVWVSRRGQECRLISRFPADKSRWVTGMTQPYPTITGSSRNSGSIKVPWTSAGSSFTVRWSLHIAPRIWNSQSSHPQHTYENIGEVSITLELYPLFHPAQEQKPADLRVDHWKITIETLLRCITLVCIPTIRLTIIKCWLGFIETILEHAHLFQPGH